MTFANYVGRKFTKPGPLKDVRALEVCTLLLGPIGTAILGEMGAEVIKVELPPLGDLSRSLGPFGWFYKEQSPMFMHINPNKHYLGLDLHKEEGQQVFKELVQHVRPVNVNQVGVRTVMELDSVRFPMHCLGISAPAVHTFRVM